MEFQLRSWRVYILVDVVDTLRVERGGSTLNTVDLVALLEKKLRKITSVLARNSSNQRSFSHDFLSPFKKLRYFAEVFARKGSQPADAVTADSLEVLAAFKENSAYRTIALTAHPHLHQNFRDVG